MSDIPDSTFPSGPVTVHCNQCGAVMKVAPEHIRAVVACPGCDADVEPWRATPAAIRQAEGESATDLTPGMLPAAGSPNVAPQPRTKPKRQPDIRKLAKAQRWMILLVLLGLVGQLVPPMLIGTVGPGRSFMIIWGILYLGVYVLMVIGTVLLLNAQGSRLPIVIIFGILAMFPCVSLILLVFVNMSATRTLRRAGLRVGFMGANKEDVERVCNPGLCSGCGYDLTGNVTGRCSECGRAIEGLSVEE